MKRIHLALIMLLGLFLGGNLYAEDDLKKTDDQKTIQWKEYLFLTGMRPISSKGPLSEIGVEPLDPEYYSEGGLKRGFLAKDAEIEGIEISAGQEVWFHPSGKLWVIKGSGHEQTIQGRAVGKWDSIYFKKTGELERVVQAKPRDPVNMAEGEIRIRGVIKEFDIRTPVDGSMDLIVLDQVDVIINDVHAKDEKGKLIGFEVDDLLELMNRRRLKSLIGKKVEVYGKGDSDTISLYGSKDYFVKLLDADSDSKTSEP